MSLITTPETNGSTYVENITIDGLGNGEVLYVNLSIVIDGDMTINASGSDPTLRIRSGQTLRITGDLINANNNVNFYVEANAFLIIEGTLSGNNNNLFGGPGTVAGGNLNLGNGAGCIGGDCPTINFPNCTAGGSFCADNNILCVKTNTISGPATSCPGVSVDLTATVPTNGSGNYSYTWESSTTSATAGFSNAAGLYTTSSTTYSTGALLNTTWFRRVVRDIGTSSAACQLPYTSNVIQVTTSYGITTQPVSMNKCTGATGSFSVTAVGTGLSYQWEQSTNNGSSWSNRANSGGFTNAGTATLSLAAAAFVAGNNGYQYRVVISKAGCSSITSNVVTLYVNAATGGWIGTNNTDWRTGANWCGSSFPNSNVTDVVINSPAPNMPAVSATGSVTCRNLTINSGATLTVSASTLTVAGNIIVNNGGTLLITGGVVPVAGTITVNSGGTISVSGGTTTATGAITVNAGGIINLTGGTFTARSAVINNGSISGTGVLTIGGTTNQSLSGTGTYGNVTLTNTAGCSAISAMTISGTLTLSTSTTFTSNGNLTMDLTTGNISNSPGFITGNVIYSKTINSAGYHYISIPSLTNKTAADWNDDITLSFGQYKNLYSYDETLPNSDKLVGWTPFASTTDALNPLKGYALYFPGNRVIDVTNSYTPGATTSPITVTNTASPVPDSDGWNLVGNPYPTTVNWDAAGWTKTNIINSIYYWDPVNSQYASYVNGAGVNGGTEFIPSMQAFWVRVPTPGTGSFNVGNAARISSENPSNFRMSANNKSSNIIRIRAINKFATDETIIRFNENAVDSFDTDYDAYKMKNEGNTPSVYTKVGKDIYSINSLSDTITELALPLHLEGVSGFYTLDIQDLNKFDSEYSIYLEDKLLNKKQNLRKKSNYSCIVNSGDASDRFVIKFKKQSSTEPVAANTNFVSVIAVDEKVDIKFLNPSDKSASIVICNIMGKEQLSLENANVSNGELSLNLPGIDSGIYIIKVITPSQSHSQRLFLGK